MQLPQTGILSDEAGNLLTKFIGGTQDPFQLIVFQHAVVPNIPVYCPGVIAVRRDALKKDHVLPDDSTQHFTNGMKELIEMM